uniref:Reverse transcriptase zinc-binding domain-containing protein n=1 Tax=Cannabis sativa TaxID=3483 RepID=A0A803QAL9_CANSA
MLFNQAMVAKHVWRLLQSLNSLPARVLKHKYFLQTSISEAKDHHGSSHLWSSLIWGLELLQTGIRKIVGDGGGCEDQWCWHYNSNGCYTVKSGYAVALDLANERNGRSSVNQSSWWNGLWNLKIPQKVKIFLWRMYHRALPTNSQLIKRKIPVQPICHRCGEATETPKHALVFCSSLLPIWSKLRVWSQLNRCRNGSLAELLVCLFAVIEQSNFELLAMIWRWVWYDRNFILFGKKQSRKDLIFELAKDVLEEFQGAAGRSNVRVSGGPRGGFSRVGDGVAGEVLGRAGRGGSLVCATRWYPPVMGGSGGAPYGAYGPVMGGQIGVQLFLCC